ncbi:MAG: TonB-dependent receptor domain-containing protein, partial [Chitinophagaceae bacterium]
MRKPLFLLISLLFLSIFVFAQQTVTGVVTDANGTPLVGVSIKLKKTGKGTVTGNDGRFQLSVSAGDELEITSVGYEPQTVTAGTGEIKVMMVQVTEELGQVVLVGSRGNGRAKTETAVPVDIIRINQVGLPTAKMDLTSVLNMAAPSFNYNKQSGADGADHIDLGTLRGLGPDHTLVLINGKRRHPTAFVGLFGTRGRGNSGVDMNGFPEASVDRIEILRDGASAQYGSDAIAGVINILLKKDINRWTINAGWSGYSDGKFNSRKFNAGNQYYSGNAIDGGTTSLSVNNGVALGKNGGFINFSLDFLKQGKTYRQVDTTNWQTDKYALPYINSLRRAFGDGSLTTGGGMYNLEAPSGGNSKTKFYSFGGFNYKSSDAFAYTRNWSARPDRFPVDAGGNIIFVPDIMRTSNDGEIYFNPHIQTHISDAALALGIKGTTASNWNWDISNNTGYNNFHYYGDKTFNASQIGKSTPNHFDDGGFNFLQNTLNIDFNKPIKTIGQGLNLGLGAEFRYEKYQIFSGEELSYKNYDPNGNQASGSQGFPGFSNKDEVNANRTNLSVYADAALDATKEWLINAAVRFENYSDFGAVFTGKLASRYKVASNFNIRGSVSTGFRAPSLAQIHFSNTLTSFSNGNLVQSLIAPNSNSLTRAAGIPELKEETSVNGS